MMLVTLKLCRVALPLMTRTDCDSITLPSHQPVASAASSNVVRKIIVLILRTLAEYLVVGGVLWVCGRCVGVYSVIPHTTDNC